MVVQRKGQRRKRGIDDLSERDCKGVRMWMRHGCGELIRLIKAVWIVARRSRWNRSDQQRSTKEICIWKCDRRGGICVRLW
jgi:hypothetical protein